VTTESSPEPRTAAALLAEHGAREGRARERRRRLGRRAGTALAVVLAYELSCYPRTRTVRVAPERAVDVLAVERDAGVLRMFGPAAAGLGPALVVRYFGAAEDPKGQGFERLAVFEWARPEAERRGLQAIVLWQLRPILTRLLPFQRIALYPFRRRTDGEWGGL
jgi:hypothetical protein